MFIHNDKENNKEYDNDEYDNEEYDDDYDEAEEEYISDGELVILEDLANHAYKSYAKHMEAVEEYEAALEKRRRYDERHAADTGRPAESSPSSNISRTDAYEESPDPFLEALRVYDEDGYDVDGFNSQGYDRENFNRAGFNRYDGYDRGGYNIYGDSRGSDLTRFPKL